MLLKPEEPHGWCKWKMPQDIVQSLRYHEYLQYFRPVMTRTVERPEVVESWPDGAFPHIYYFRGDGGVRLEENRERRGKVRIVAKPGQTLWEIRVFTGYSKGEPQPHFITFPYVPVLDEEQGTWEAVDGRYDTANGKLILPTSATFLMAGLDLERTTEFAWIKAVYEKGVICLANARRNGGWPCGRLHSTSVRYVKQLFPAPRKRTLISKPVEKFHVRGWNYSHERQEQFIKEIRAGGHGELAERLTASTRYGGKAFGLTLSEALAKLSGDARFNVPPWAPSQSGAILSDWHYYMVRSSGYEEDWADPRPGVDESKPCSANRLESLLEAMRAEGRQAVVQEFVWGIGFVIDVGYSELLRRPVVRLAYGNISNQGGSEVYTSATWDRESHVGLYELDGGPIVPFRWSRFEDIIPDLTRAIVRGLEELGIEFGVQLEVIIDPKRPIPWHLVQIRPSPETVYGPEKRLMVRGELLATTGKVSGVGTAEGEVIFLTDDILNRKEQERKERDLRGKIVLWDPQRQCMLRYGVANLLEAGQKGAAGQITWRRLFGNSSHGTFGKLGEHYESEYAELVHQERPLLSLPPQGEHEEWVRRCYRGTPTRLRIVSDGLVGQVYAV